MMSEFFRPFVLSIYACLGFYSGSVFRLALWEEGVLGRKYLWWNDNGLWNE